MLVRTKRANAGIEVFMVRRSARSPFAPDAIVFPGGALDPEDADLVAAAVRELEEETGVRLDRSALVPFSHWITPPNEGRRYDTHFFLAVAPEDQTPVADEHETHDGRWLDPNDALASRRDGALRLMYPTIKHLERLAAFGSVDALMAFARAKPIVTIAPHISPDDGYVMPADLEGAW
jgi:8-oxo-dGTP pyrophosphatase MutT (NUDIX family)